MNSDAPRRGPPSDQLHLPAGFRFYPSDEELVVHYLRRKANSLPFNVPIIAEIDLYKFDPWDLPEKAIFGEKEWYFFSPRDRKYPNGSRPNRAAGSGYWKATGTDKPISIHGGKQKVGVKKALVFYTGKAPKGDKTNWIMHEYRLADGAAKAARRKGSTRLDDWVLCRIYKKMPSAAKLAMKEANENNRFEDMLECLPNTDEKETRLRSNFMVSPLNSHNAFNGEENMLEKFETTRTAHYNFDSNESKQGGHMDTYANYYGSNNHEKLSLNASNATSKQNMMLNIITHQKNRERLMLANPNLMTHHLNFYSEANAITQSHDSPVDSSIVDEDSTFQDEKLTTKVNLIGTIPNDQSLQFLLDGLPSPFGSRLEPFQPFSF